MGKRAHRNDRPEHVYLVLSEHVLSGQTLILGGYYDQTKAIGSVLGSPHLRVVEVRIL